ncbi:hypothetical protein HY468_03095 [Candidatus Roizmanbacteria bacterium]|nr:hypothetical protein [Candidatus Roizmanbacteria bacterium]
MNIIYTKHASDKLKTKEAKKFKITKKKIESGIINPESEEELEGEISRCIGHLNTKHSLCIIHRKDNGDTKVITFFPAEKGRYERKVL